MVYRDLEVPIPEGTHVAGDRVQIVRRILGRTEKTLVGMVSREGYMYPNQGYFQRIPEAAKWKLPRGYPRAHLFRVHVGYLALLQTVGERTGLYPILLDTHGPEIANGLMDCCMEDLIASSNLDPEDIYEVLTFSLDRYKDRWYRTVLGEAMEEKNAAFRGLWFQRCRQLHIRNVCISVDRLILEPGDEERPGASGRCRTVYWILAAEGRHRGLPVTYFWTEDREIDPKMLEKLLAYLKYFGLQVKGILADQAFCTKASLEALAAQPVDFYVQMAQESCGYQEVNGEYGKAVRESVRYALSRGYMFGTAVSDKKLVDDSDLRGTIAILYHSLQGTKRAMDLIEAVFRAAERGNRAIEAGEVPSIPDKCRPFLKMENGKLEKDFPVLQAVVDVQGYRCICSQSEKTAEEFDDTFRVREASGNALSDFQAQIRGESQTEDSVSSGLFQCFLSAILGSVVEKACERARVEEADAVADLRDVVYLRCGKRYQYDGDEPDEAWVLLEKCGVTESQIHALQPLLDLLYDAEEGRVSKPAARTFTEPESNKPKKAEKQQLLYQGKPVGGDLQALPDPSELDAEPEQTSKNQKPAPQKRGGKRAQPAKREPAGSKKAQPLTKEERMREYREACKAAGIELPEKLPAGRPKSIETLLREKRAAEQANASGEAD